MGSRSTTKTEIPAYLEEAGRLAVQRAQEIQGMGYVPYMGPEVAAVNPFEQAAATNVGGMAAAFGMQAPSGIDMGGMPTVTQGGMTGYSSYPAYVAALERLREQRPDQYEYLSGMTRFDPVTGMENPEYVARMAAAATPAPAPSGSGGSSSNLQELMQANAERVNASEGSGGFDPLGPSGNYSLDLSETPVGRLFGGLNRFVGN